MTERFFQKPIAESTIQDDVEKVNVESNSEVPKEESPAVGSESSAEKKLTDEEIDNLVELAERKIKDQERVVQIKREMGVDPYEIKSEIKDVNPEDWSLVLFDRLNDPRIKEKFIASKAEVLRSDRPYDNETSDSDGAGNNQTKLKIIKDYDTKKYHYDSIRDYDDRIKRTFDHTTYVEAKEQLKKSRALGTNRENGTVFIDAEKNGVPLNSRQKNIIESHEKGHVFRSFIVNTTDICKGFDLKKIPEDAERPSYLKNPDELIERMSQLKNYFNFKSDEPFSREHLRYAREHYVKDTGLDNNMTEFFGMVTPEKEDEFLRVINQYPI